MKYIFITLVLLATGSTVSFAQCDKQVTLTASKTQHFDAQGGLKAADDEKTIIKFSKTDINIAISGAHGDIAMTGKVNSDTCDWKVPFKDGKTILHTTLTNSGGESRDYDVTITGKDGKITLTASSADDPDDVIKLDIEKFEEGN
jgi:hypothetical protein